MLDKENLEVLSQLVDRATGQFKGSYLLVTVVGGFGPQGDSVDVNEELDFPMMEKPLPKSKVEIFEKKPFRRIIHTKSVDTIWEHEKGSVIRIVGGFSGEELIVSEKIEYIAIQCGMNVK